MLPEKNYFYSYVADKSRKICCHLTVFFKVKEIQRENLVTIVFVSIIFGRIEDLFTKEVHVRKTDMNLYTLHSKNQHYYFCQTAKSTFRSAEVYL